MDISSSMKSLALKGEMNHIYDIFVFFEISRNPGNFEYLSFLVEYFLVEKRLLAHLG